MMKTIQAKTVSDEIFEQLTFEIVTGKLKPGEQLPNQRKLAEQLGVNMAPLREALSQLEQIGLVEVRHGRSMVVKDWKVYGSLDLLPYSVFTDEGLNIDVVISYLEGNRIFTSYVARMSAKRATESDVRKLRNLLKALKAETDPIKQMTMQWEVGDLLVDFSRNTLLKLMHNQIRAIIVNSAPLFMDVFANNMKRIDSFENMADAIESKDPAASSKHVLAYADGQANDILTALGSKSRRWE